MHLVGRKIIGQSLEMKMLKWVWTLEGWKSEQFVTNNGGHTQVWSAAVTGNSC